MNVNEWVNESLNQWMKIWEENNKNERTNSAASSMPSTIPPTNAAQFNPYPGGGEIYLFTTDSSDIISTHSWEQIQLIGLLFASVYIYERQKTIRIQSKITLNGGFIFWFVSLLEDCLITKQWLPYGICYK